VVIKYQNSQGGARETALSLMEARVTAVSLMTALMTRLTLMMCVTVTAVAGRLMPLLPILPLYQMVKFQKVVVSARLRGLTSALTFMLRGLTFIYTPTRHPLYICTYINI
jgi:hypothetical protein